MTYLSEHLSAGFMQPGPGPGPLSQGLDDPPPPSLSKGLDLPLLYVSEATRTNFFKISSHNLHNV